MLRIARIAVGTFCMLYSARSQQVLVGDTYEAISAQVENLRGSNDATPEDILKIQQGQAALHDMAGAVILKALTEDTAAQDSLTALQGIRSLGALSELSNIPFSEKYKIGNIEVAVAAFAVLGRSGGVPDIRSYVQFYSSGGGIWELKEEINSEFDGRSFSIAKIDSPVAREIWLLAWGKVVGDSGARLRIRLYGFDGFQVRTVWGRDDLRGGLVRVEESKVTLNYFEMPDAGVLTPPREIVEVLYPGFTGLGKK